MNDDWKGEHFLKITPAKSATGSADTRMFTGHSKPPRNRSGKYAPVRNNKTQSGASSGGMRSGNLSPLVNDTFKSALTSIEGDTDE